MTKKILLALPIVAATVFLSGCSLGTGLVPANKSTMVNATFMRTDDGGISWTPKMRIDDKKNIAGIDVLSMAVHPNDSSIVYLGTAANGIFATKDGGENWTQSAFPDKVYGLVFDPRDPNVMYGSGVLNGRAKIFKRLAEGQEWKEIYTEPADGTTIASIGISRANSQVIYAGTSEGVIIKTTDGGTSWVNLKKADGPIIAIGFDAASDSHVFFGVYLRGVLETKNGGAGIENINEKVDPVKRTSTVYSLVTDPYLGGVVYVGTEAGIFRRSGGETWNELNLIASSKAFPIRAIAVNPKNSREIMYSSSKAIYKSSDTGVTWSTFQLDTSKEISTLRYNLNEPAKIYAGMRGF